MASQRAPSWSHKLNTKLVSAADSHQIHVLFGSLVDLLIGRHLWRFWGPDWGLLIRKSKKLIVYNSLIYKMAETVGFEPTIEFPL